MHSLQPINAHRIFASYAHKWDTHNPFSDPQRCQFGDLADGLDTSRELVLVQRSEYGLYSTLANVCTRQKHSTHPPMFGDPNQMNAPTSINECEKKKRKERSDIPTNKYTIPPPTHSSFRLVSLLKALTPPVNRLLRRFLNASCDQHG